VLRAAEATSTRLRKTRPPSTKTIEELDGVKAKAQTVNGEQ
jgi:hypothetical protein